MNKTTKRLKRVEKKLYKLLDKKFGIKKYSFIGDMYNGELFVVVHAKEKR